MLKNILKLEGVKKLNKNQQQEVHGGTIGPSLTQSQCEGLGGTWFCVYRQHVLHCYCTAIPSGDQ